MKEERRMGVYKIFRPHPLNIRERPFGYIDTSFSRKTRVVALAIAMLPSNVSILLQI